MTDLCNPVLIVVVNLYSHKTSFCFKGVRWIRNLVRHLKYYSSKSYGFNDIEFDNKYKNFGNFQQSLRQFN